MHTIYQFKGSFHQFYTWDRCIVSVTGLFVAVVQELLNIYVENVSSSVLGK